MTESKNSVLEMIRLGAILVCYAVASCTVLAIVNNFTSEKIRQNNIEKAKEHFEQSYKYLLKNEGIKFYAYAEYAVFKAKFLEKTGLEEERRAVLEEAYAYCISHDFLEKASRLKAEGYSFVTVSEMLGISGGAE